MELDRTDFEILAALQNNARLSNKELAAAVGLSPSSCLQRVRTLRRMEVLLDHRVEVNPEALGIGVRALIDLRMAKSSRACFQKLWDHLFALPAVVAIYNVSGAFDLQVEVVVRDIGHLRDLVVDSIANQDEIDRLVTSVVFSSARKAALPRYTGA